ncbi:MAG: hypothetical protein WBA93_27675 [Microcoleaceae cyanobacterium]
MKWNSKDRDEWVTWFGVFIIALFALVLIRITVTIFDLSNIDLGIEIVKLLLQLIIVIIIGGTFSYIVKEIQYEQQKREAIKELKKSLLDQLLDDYSQVKNVRRLLRARGITPINLPNDLKSFLQKIYDDELKEQLENSTDTKIEEFVEELKKAEGKREVLPEVYNQQLEILNNIQLNLEVIGTRIRSSQYLFTQGEQLVKDIRQMDKYLGTIVHEWERNQGRLNNNAISPLLSDKNFQKLSDFLTLIYEKPSKISRFENSRFKTEFVDIYRKVVAVIQKEILEIRE